MQMNERNLQLVEVDQQKEKDFAEINTDVNKWVAE